VILFQRYADLYSSQPPCSLYKRDKQIGELFSLKPLKLLEQASKVFPLCISFYLRELYLRKNLSFEYQQNKIVFKYINDGYLHDYTCYLMGNKFAADVIINHESTLSAAQVKVFMENCETYEK
jgi:hypothetical protein